MDFSKKFIMWFAAFLFVLMSFCETLFANVGTFTKTLVTSQSTESEKNSIQNATVTETSETAAASKTSAASPTSAVPEKPTESTSRTTPNVNPEISNSSSTNSSATKEPSSTPDNTVQEKEIEDYLRSAVNYIKEKGKTSAIGEFNKSDGLFTKEHKYIFVIDYLGIILSNPKNPDLVGKNQNDLQDSDGRYITREAIEKAKLGGGWILYRFKNPENDKIECKKSFILPLPGEYLIGSGYYYPPNASGGC